MGYLFDERKFLNDTATIHESRLTSQFSRFLDSTPTFVTYYNISNIATTVDYGFKNVERILGNTSPVRFNKVNNLPIYGIDTIIPQIEDAEEGLNTSFDGEGVLLPSTVQPNANDFFYINYLGKHAIFMVTSFEKDSLRIEGYMKVQFTLKYLYNDDRLEQLEKQTIESFECYYENIGTQEKVLIRETDIEVLNSLNKITTEISNYYKILFYDRKYNSFLFNQTGRTRLYDRLLTHFITKNKVFYNRSQYDTIHLTVEDPSRLLLAEYHNSIFRAIEERKPELIKPMYYSEGFANDISSIFFHWRDNSIRTTYFNIGNIPYIRPEIIEMFKDAEIYYTEEEVKVEVEREVEQIVNVSIPVEDNKAFVQDAGYVPREDYRSQTSTSIKKPSLNEESSNSTGISVKGKLSAADLSSLVSSPKVKAMEDEVILAPINKPIMNITKDILEEKMETEVIVTRVKDIVIEHRTKIPEGYDIAVLTITMFLSGNSKSLSDIQVEELLNYADFMHPNHETFVLIPILLYVLESYYKSAISLA